MRELTIHDIETIIRSDENRILEVKKTTGEIDAGMSSGCAFLNTDGGWLLFGIAPKSLKILGQDVTDPTKQEIANHLRKFDRSSILTSSMSTYPRVTAKRLSRFTLTRPNIQMSPTPTMDALTTKLRTQRP